MQCLATALSTCSNRVCMGTQHVCESPKGQLLLLPSSFSFQCTGCMPIAVDIIEVENGLCSLKHGNYTRCAQHCTHTAHQNLPQTYNQIPSLHSSYFAHVETNTTGLYYKATLCCSSVSGRLPTSHFRATSILPLLRRNPLFSCRVCFN